MLHAIVTPLFAVIALLWLVAETRLLLGSRRIPFLKNVTPLADADCPSVSILFSARNEAAKLPQALPTLLAQDYPRFEVVAVDDRSEDATGQLLDQAADQNPRLRVVHVTELPPGWLGKPHGLQTAYENSSGEWLVFTDADVRFAPDVLRRALALAREREWDHLTLPALLDTRGFWEHVAISFFALAFSLHTEPGRVSNPRSRHYMGVGSFQLLRRSAYEAIGTHRRLALEVVDDMKLGKLVKRGGFRSGLAFPEERLRIRWQEGLGNITRGLTKNFFAAAGFNVSWVALNVVGLLLLSVLPFVALPFLRGTALLLDGVAVGMILLAHAAAAHNSRLSPLYAVTHALGGTLFAYMLARSTAVTLWRGGVVWRGTFCPLEELRKGMV